MSGWRAGFSVHFSTPPLLPPATALAQATVTSDSPPPGSPALCLLPAALNSPNVAHINPLSLGANPPSPLTQPFFSPTPNVNIVL